METTGGRLERIAMIGATMVVVAVAVVLGWTVFVRLPGDGAELAGVLVTLVFALIVGRMASNMLGNVFSEYNVGEVAVEGPISRDGGRPSPMGAAMGTTADGIVDRIEAADDDPNVDALLLRLNTPGGEVLPSDDIRRAAAAFDGPTVAYATDVCASGGYWIAAGCDELWAHETSLVGSIGVLGSRPNAAGLAEKLGISYEQFTAGRYKDAGIPLKELDEEERAYLQGIVDDLYGHFVDTVAEGRGMEPAAIRDTEARVFLGPDARDRGLVDHVGTREDVHDRLEAELGEEITVHEFSPTRGLVDRIQIGVRGVAYAAGAGVASVLTTKGDGDVDLKLR